MKRNNALRFFGTEIEAKEFAVTVGSDDWGWEENIETGAVRWFVEYFNPDWE